MIYYLQISYPLANRLSTVAKKLTDITFEIKHTYFKIFTNKIYIFKMFIKCIYKMNILNVICIRNRVVSIYLNTKMVINIVFSFIK